MHVDECDVTFNFGLTPDGESRSFTRGKVRDAGWKEQMLVS